MGEGETEGWLGAPWEIRAGTQGEEEGKGATLGDTAGRRSCSRSAGRTPATDASSAWLG
jgi:hypothetical protein